MVPQLYWMTGGPGPGRLGISARPRGGDWLEDEIEGWRRAGVEVVVSLLESAEAAELGLEREGDLARKAGLRFYSFPVLDRGVPDSVSSAARLFEELRMELAAGRSVAVHCRQGIGRSGMTVAGILMVSGMDAGTALRTASEARGMALPETTEQRAWVEGLLAEHLAIAARR